MKCTRCGDTAWVCEDHLMRPWEGEHACTCGGAGAPCGRCNTSDDGSPPRMPKGFKIKIDKDGWRH